ncbi:LD-carboxypeptidase [Pullulanibacillus sp. KACC 23026]|uniref:S66 family peptidase n=1 Tax=Pullulanibacillus sp. KACC 23026 TaxID=3028315 RepID=UPI0023B0AE15|nr:S66 peptidase family protein [Pullulanibacillus sp. KACC 23026]WEG10888.1 LD-carboxypeptidase [Pullulanibacillus sp. KACC 23026]
MIIYPILHKGATIGVTAPSSGIEPELHHLVKQACDRLQQEGYRTICGDTVWTQEKAKSAIAKVRAEELNQMLQDSKIDLILPPWGGELLIEILDLLDYKAMDTKWIMGYSDTSGLLLAITLKTGIATAHGVNLVDLRGEFSDTTTALWETVLSTKAGDSVVQQSSPFYQKEWHHDNPSPCVYHLTEKTEWKTIQGTNIHVTGRLLGGCVDIIRHLIGTPFGDVQAFREEYISGDPIVWYLENCELSTTDLKRTLVQMKLAGWFDHCTGILFGRSDANEPVENYEVIDIYKELSEELNVPIVYDIDCGHVPPQITFINGAYAEIDVTEAGNATVIQHFR